MSLEAQAVSSLWAARGDLSPRILIDSILLSASFNLSSTKVFIYVSVPTGLPAIRTPACWKSKVGGNRARTSSEGAGASGGRSRPDFSGLRDKSAYSRDRRFSMQRKWAYRAYVSCHSEYRLEAGGGMSGMMSSVRARMW